jgi:hypothetical protein
MGKAKRPVLTLVLGGVVIAAAGFGGGVLVGRANAPETLMTFEPGQMGQGQFRQGMGLAEQGNGDAGDANRPGGLTQGTIKSIDGDTMTVETEDGDVKVALGDDTQVTLSGQASDLEEGDQVTVMGAESEEGIDAMTVTEGDGPMLRFQGGPPASAAPSN